MTAWSVLISNSTLPSGTAWEHLNNQEGGGGPSVIIGCSMQAEITSPVLSASNSDALSSSIDVTAMEATVGELLSANVTYSKEATICQQ